MNLVLIEPEEVSPQGTVVLCGRRAEHITTVLRCKPKDRIRAGLVDGPVGTAQIQRLGAGEVELLLDPGEYPPSPPPIDLILALPRPIMLRRILAHAATMGVGRILLTGAAKVEKSFFSATMVRERDFRRYLLLGLEQAMDTRLPELRLYPRLGALFDDLPAVAPTPDGLRLLAHPGPADSFPSLLARRPQGRVLLAVGPEGGWSDAERDSFHDQGFLPASCGPRILRVDTAVVALIARVQLLLALTGQ